MIGSNSGHWDVAECHFDAKRAAFASATRYDLIGSVELLGLDHIWLKPDAD